jgi:hypothetical protein
VLHKSLHCLHGLLQLLCLLHACAAAAVCLGCVRQDTADTPNGTICAAAAGLVRNSSSRNSGNTAVV